MFLTPGTMADVTFIQLNTLREGKVYLLWFNEQMSSASYFSGICASHSFLFCFCLLDFK